MPTDDDDETIASRIRRAASSVRAWFVGLWQRISQ